MRRYSEAAWERAMKVEEIILRAYAKKDQLDRGSGDIGNELPSFETGTGKA